MKVKDRERGRVGTEVVCPEASLSAVWSPERNETDTIQLMTEKGKEKPIQYN